ncbi:MAG: metallophosphoesterase family protein [Pseudomonadota bacterium]
MILFDETRPLFVFGGPYSNLQATEAALQEAARLAIPSGNLICTGDVVAYAGDPLASIAAVRHSGAHVIAGNCEEQLGAEADDCGCGFDEGSACDRLSRDWYAFANAEMTPDARAWMRGLPPTLEGVYRGRTLRVVHGGVASNNRFLFASQHADLAQEFRAAAADVVIAGHSGLPFIGQTDGGVWFNPGVVGVPANDGTRDGWYGLIAPASDDPRDGLVFSTHRLAYDWQAAAASIRASGHADPYAEALETGRWPSLDILPDRERAATGKAIAPERLTAFAALHAGAAG